MSSDTPEPDEPEYVAVSSADDEVQHLLPLSAAISISLLPGLSGRSLCWQWGYDQTGLQARGVRRVIADLPPCQPCARAAAERANPTGPRVLLCEDISYGPTKETT